jgi:hypothetical protein
MSSKASATVSGTWIVEEEKKLASAVETFGAHNWAKVAVNVPGRNEKQCSSKWHYLSSKASATASGAWTVEEENKLASAVETVGTTSWAKIAMNVPGRNKSQCQSKWQNMSKKAAAASNGNTTAEDVGDNMPRAETTTDRDTSGDEPPVKRSKVDQVGRPYIS